MREEKLFTKEEIRCEKDSSMKTSHVMVDKAITVVGVEKLVLSKSGEEPFVDVGLHFVIDGRWEFELVEDFHPTDVVEIALARTIGSYICIQHHQPG